MPSTRQIQSFRRGLTLAALLWAEPRRVADLAAELGATERDVQRLMEGLRGEGAVVEVEARGRERYHRIVALPEWMAKYAWMLVGSRRESRRPR